MLIAPSILSADFLHLAKDVELVNAHADLFHLDVMDGVLVPNISFGFPVVEAIAREARKPLDVHLMITRPETYVTRFAEAGASYISFHYEATGDRTDAVLDLIHEAGVKAGIAINPDCPVEKVYPYLGKADFIVLMSVFAGFGGQKFIEGTFGRLRTLRAEMDRRQEACRLIEVDGGVGPSNAMDLTEAGADILVAGSAVFKSQDPAAPLRAMRQRM